jgi:hypothetical protein
MAEDIFKRISTNELEKEITACVAKDARSLPPKAKVFSAIAKIQEFDKLPELMHPDQFNAAILAGGMELQRGMSATKGIPSQFYARELILGAMYPGTLSVLGNGMYFATPSQKNEKPDTAALFPTFSRIAMHYTRGNEGTGILVRAAIKKDAKVAAYETLWTDYVDSKSKANRAGIKDVGAFAAVLGFDAFYADGAYVGGPCADIKGEMVYVVLNRGAMMVQNACLMM